MSDGLADVDADVPAVRSMAVDELLASFAGQLKDLALLSTIQFEPVGYMPLRHDQGCDRARSGSRLEMPLLVLMP